MEAHDDALAAAAGRNHSMNSARGIVGNAPKRSTEPSAGSWAEPSNYGGKTGVFFRGEVAKSFADGNTVALVPGTTSNAVKWANQVDSVAIEGLYGCTAVVVVSQRGVGGYNCFQ